MTSRAGLLAIVLTLACGAGPAVARGPDDRVDAPSEAGVAARVNGMPIPRSELDEAVEAFRRDNDVPPDLPADEADRIRALVRDGLIGSLLLYQRALALQIRVPGAEVDRAMEQARRSAGEEAFVADLARRGLTEQAMRDLVARNLTIQRMIRETILDEVTIEEKEIADWYARNAEAMNRPASVRAGHLLVRVAPDAPDADRAAARQRAAEALARIRAGEPFARVAREVSDDPSAARGGDLGWIARGTLVPDLDGAFFALDPGRVSGIVESPFGFHLLEVRERKDAGRMDLEEAREGIVEVLRQRRSAEALDRLVGELRATARIEVY